MRHFHKLLFLGNGEQSQADCKKLIQRIDDALITSSYLQQAPRGKFPEGEQDLEDAVRDLAAALLGREIDFGAELPY